MLIKSILAVFPNVSLRANEIGRFRGFLNQQFDWQDTLFHNHTDKPNGVIYRYPRIQYRVYRGKAALFGIEAGYQALQSLLNDRIEELPADFWDIDRFEQRTNLMLTEESHRYILNQWLALNTVKNRDGSILDLEAAWNGLTTEKEKTAMLERILAAQLLKFCREMGCQLPDKGLTVSILDAEDTGAKLLHSATGRHFFKSFRVHYTTNLQLPDFLALGKGVSKGYGWQIRMPADKQH